MYRWLSVILYFVFYWRKKIRVNFATNFLNCVTFGTVKGDKFAS